MLKAKNIMIILILNYLLIVVVCSFAELLFINNKAQNLQLMIRTAADMALEQVQATDDFFLPSQGYMLESNTSAYTISVPHQSGSGYKKVNAFEAMTGKSNKKDIFKEIYGKGNIADFISDTNVEDLEVTAGYWSYNAVTESSSFQWYKIPRISQMGNDVTMHGDVFKAYDIYRNLAPSDVIQGIWANYGLIESEKIAYLSDGSTVNYFMSPISLGITYINEDILQYFFMNNMDLLMRSKYAKEGTPLNSEAGGMGLLKGSTYTDMIAELPYNANPINNGEFTLLRGTEVYEPNTSALLYEGVKPLIRYKVIDMYDNSPENESLLSLIFGAYPNKNGSKADYFREQDINVVDPATNLPYEHKPIVVAEVTFYADIIVPYTSLPLREMRANETEMSTLDTMFLFGNGIGAAQPENYIDLVREGSFSTGIVSKLGNRSNVIKYTRLFAVAP